MGEPAWIVVPLTAEEFDDLARPLVGLEVSSTWKGHGTAIFLELGALRPNPSLRRKGSFLHDKGEATIMIQWDWRIEDGARVVCGSCNKREEIEAGIASLQGTAIRSIAAAGNIPELRVEFSDGRCLQSMVLFNDDPQWAVFLPDRRWLSVKEGSLGVSDGSESPVPKEDREG